MSIRSPLIGAGILACAWILSANGSASAHGPGPSPHAPALASRPAAGDSENKCLGCHGSFDKIIEASARYVAPSGEKTSPHRYVPHDSKREEDIPACSHCHTAHPLDPLPAKGSIDLSKVDVQWCYDTCHHEKDFTPCKKCHP